MTSSTADRTSEPPKLEHMDISNDAVASQVTALSLTSRDCTNFLFSPSNLSDNCSVEDATALSARTRWVRWSAYKSHMINCSSTSNSWSWSTFFTLSCDVLEKALCKPAGFGEHTGLSASLEGLLAPSMQYSNTCTIGESPSCTECAPPAPASSLSSL